MNSVSEEFNRNVYSLFGLPVDNLSMAQAKALMARKTKNPGNSVLSTININWIANAFKDESFYRAIVNSDIVTIDGRPLFWLAKMFGLPISEVVAGSTLIEEIHKDTNRQFSIFLFGGEEGVASRALEKINSTDGGLQAVGALNPGFGTVDDMSSDDIIEDINSAHADILLVALGAKKGTQWIEKNRNKLNSKIISHLGATINFLGGTVPRAPKIFRQLGSEWIWRILQEPKLFTRYFYDGLLMLKVLARQLRVWFVYSKRLRAYIQKGTQLYVHIRESKKKFVITFVPGFRTEEALTPVEAFSRCAASKKDVILDFQRTTFVNPAVMGVMSLLLKHQRNNGLDLAVANADNKLYTILSLFVFWNSHITIMPTQCDLDQVANEYL